MASFSPMRLFAPLVFALLMCHTGHSFAQEGETSSEETAQVVQDRMDGKKDESFRIANPLSLSVFGKGWDVDPRKGSLGMNISLGHVSGPMPIPVTFRLQGSYLERRNASEGGKPESFSRFPLYGTLHFGYCGLPNQTYMLEDGTSFTEEELVPFSEIHHRFTLPQDFGFNAKDVGMVKANVLGTLAVYTSNLAELGKWQDKVQACLPNNCGALSGDYTIVMDKDHARIYANRLGDRAHLPVLWVDRFGHAVTLQWRCKKTELPEGVTAIHCVEVCNHLNKGVHVQWVDYCKGDVEQEKDLMVVRFIGIHGPAMHIRGYAGMATIGVKIVSPREDFRQSGHFSLSR